jgi:hypothetical protein
LLPVDQEAENAADRIDPNIKFHSVVFDAGDTHLRKKTYYLHAVVLIIKCVYEREGGRQKAI